MARGTGCELEVGETSPLYKATQFSHCLGLHKEPPQKKRGPNVTDGYSQQTPQQDQAWQNGLTSSQEPGSALSGLVL